MERIPVAGPWITQREINYVTDAVSNGWYSNATSYITKFENCFAEYSGVNFAVSLPSCTSAIHLSLLACGVGPEDEVIVPDTTWIATAAPITYIGATPIFADIDRNSWCLSAKSFEKCITPKTKAVIPVDLYGNMPDMDAILEIAHRHDIKVIEDAAEAIGSEYKKRKAGSFGDTGVFSFHGTKTLTTGEGGMLITDNEKIYQRVLLLRDHGRRSEDKMFYNREIAYKYKMSNLQAALGLAQLERIEELLSKKKNIFSWYQNRLGGLNGVTLNHQQTCTKNTYWMVTLIIDKKYGLKKESIIKQLKEKNIDSRPFFYPLSSIPAYRDTIKARKAQNFNKISYEINPFGVNLPSALKLTEEKVDFVCEVLKNNILKIK
jgi:perosamine synthetase